MASLSLASAHAPAASIGPAVIVAAVLVIAWRFVIDKGGKGTPAGRLVAVLLAAVAGWVLLAVTHPAAATTIAAGSADGVATLAGAIAGILHAV